MDKEYHMLTEEEQAAMKDTPWQEPKPAMQALKEPTHYTGFGDPLAGSRDTKDTNPKDAIGDTKVPIAFTSPIAEAHWAAAQDLGLVKYGAWNWRICGARASVYISAGIRHFRAYQSGETYDPVDGTHHMGNVMACAAILIEAKALGVLIDDRPPGNIKAMRAAYAQVEANMVKVRERYKDKDPRHYTIADTPLIDEHGDPFGPLDRRAGEKQGSYEDVMRESVPIIAEMMGEKQGDPFAAVQSIYAEDKTNDVLERAAVKIEHDQVGGLGASDLAAAFIRGLKI